jgi:NAD(P)-dependent dehydrogenase (short-subunit alcohol dehydrogenase family)
MDPNGTGPQSLLKSAAFPKATKLIAMDVTSDSDVARAVEEVTTSLKKEGLNLWAIVNNAGIFRCAHVEWGKLEDYQKVLDVNVIGMARVTRAFLPLIRKSKGRVVNIASIAGRIAGPGLAIYSLSKHSVVAFSTALRREMMRWGVKVSTIEPAIYKTPMADVKTLYDGARKMWDETPESIKDAYGQDYFNDTLRFLDGSDGRDNPEEVVDALFDAIAAAEPEIRYKVCGFKYALIWLASEYLPFSVADALSKLRGINVKPKGLVE